MEDVILIVAFSGVIIFGFFIMKRLDDFFEKNSSALNRKSGEVPPSDREVKAPPRTKSGAEDINAASVGTEGSKKTREEEKSPSPAKKTNNFPTTYKRNKKYR